MVIDSLMPDSMRKQIDDGLEYSASLKNFWEQSRTHEQADKLRSAIHAEAERDMFLILRGLPSDHDEEKWETKRDCFLYLLNNVDVENSHYGTLCVILIKSDSNEPQVMEARDSLIQRVKDSSAISSYAREMVLGSLDRAR